MRAERVRMRCEVVFGVEVEAVDDAEAAAQRRGEERPPGWWRATRVKGLSGIFIDRAPGPVPTMRSSDAVLEGGVEDLLDLGVETVDLVDEEDLAGLECGEDGGEVAGPLDDRARGGLDAATSSSAAMTWARLVLPTPGGPKSRTWSRASPRARAASMATRRFSTTCALARRTRRVGAGAARARSRVVVDGAGR